MKEQVDFGLLLGQDILSAGYSQQEPSKNYDVKFATWLMVDKEICERDARYAAYRIGKVMREYGAFFILVFILSLPFLAVGAMSDLALPLGLPIAALMFPCPLIATSILVYREEGRDGVKRLLKRVFDHKRIRKKAWYAAIFFLLPAIYLLSYAIMYLMGTPLPNPLSPVLLPLLFIIFFIAAACEEAGWTGYATDPLQAKWTALGAGIIIGIIWAAWHVIPDIQAGQAWDYILWERCNTVFLRVLMVWIYNNAGRSVFSVVVVHAMINVSFFTLFPEAGYYAPAVTAMLVAAVAVLAASLWGPRTLAKYRFGRK